MIGCWWSCDPCLRLSAWNNLLLHVWSETALFLRYVSPKHTKHDIFIHLYRYFIFILSSFRWWGWKSSSCSSLCQHKEQENIPVFPVRSKGQNQTLCWGTMQTRAGSNRSNPTHRSRRRRRCSVHINQIRTRWACSCDVTAAVFKFSCCDVSPLY